jgi:hypothetical protein
MTPSGFKMPRGLPSFINPQETPSRGPKDTREHPKGFGKSRSENSQSFFNPGTPSPNTSTSSANMSGPKAQQLYAAVNDLSAKVSERDGAYQDLIGKLATRVNDQEAKIHRLESEKKKLWDRLQRTSEFLQATVDEKVNGAIDAFNRRADQQDREESVFGGMSANRANRGAR